MADEMYNYGGNKKTTDKVNQPAHYMNGSIECIDAIRAGLTADEFLGYCKGNVLKYVWRERWKGGKEDLEKAAIYLKWAVEAALKEQVKVP